ncbi:5'-methylthioadenosine/adenosylhomocysteine nucleosidase [soil metagenome]
MVERKIGIMGAMPEEIDGVVQLLENKQETSLGRRIYYTGSIYGIDTVVVFSRWGKVAAAATATSLILEFGITEIIFTGVAGAIDQTLNIGDIVIGRRLIQHDMDARPLMPQFEIPLLGKTFFETSEAAITKASHAVKELIENDHLQTAIGTETLRQFGINAPKLLAGDIASGDKFFSNNADKESLVSSIPSALCVEMEGAAVAQVCYEYDIPFTIIRTISDTANERSVIDFPLFIKNISSKYSVEIIRNIYRQFV